MANSRKARPVCDWAATEYVIEMLDDIRKRLKVGAQGPGVTFDADECAKVLGALVDPSFPNSRPPHDGVREFAIYLFCLKLGWTGVSSKNAIDKNAIADAAEHFGCSISTVRAALKAICE
jgi:hypothetical protein